MYPTRSSTVERHVECHCFHAFSDWVASILPRSRETAPTSLVHRARIPLASMPAACRSATPIHNGIRVTLRVPPTELSTIRGPGSRSPPRPTEPCRRERLGGTRWGAGEGFDLLFTDLRSMLGGTGTVLDSHRGESLVVPWLSRMEVSNDGKGDRDPHDGL
jgi:hypothetical protein